MKENSIHGKQGNREATVIRGHYFNAHDLLTSNLDEIPYLLEPLITRGELTALIGPGDVGKSILLRDLSISIVNQEDNYLGYRLHLKTGKVLYVSLEDNKYRLANQIKRTRINRENAANLDFITMLIDDFEDPFDELEKAVRIDRYDLVVVDPISNMIFEDWKDQGALRQSLLQFSLLAMDYECAVILMHHITKEASKSAPNANNAVGSQAFANMARTVMELRRRPSNKEERGLFLIKANGLDDDFKKAGVLLRMNNDFSYSKIEGEVAFSEFDAEASVKLKFNNKEEIIRFAKGLKEPSQASVIREIKKHFGGNCPKDTQLKTWLKEQ
jgi:predicted ATP-dependent serine protease